MLGELRERLTRFVERELKARLGERWLQDLEGRRERPYPRRPDGGVGWDTQALLKAIVDNWQGVFRQPLCNVDRAFISELLEVRNGFAHEQPFSYEDTFRALDTAQRLLTNIAARPQAEAIQKMRVALGQTVREEQARQKTRTATLTLEGAAKTGLKPWREVVTPHRDVASGRFQQAEFAADLWQVPLGEGTDEYRDPVEFFRRTYPHREPQAAARSARCGGSPARAATRWCSSRPTSAAARRTRCWRSTTCSRAQRPSELPGVDGVMRGGRRRQRCPTAHAAWCWWATRSRPATRSTKPDGTVVRTLWGELAWQLGGREGLRAACQADDEQATSPGDVLRELFNELRPVPDPDRRVGGLRPRQLHDQGDLPAGGFETQFTFAQALTESAKRGANCLLVVSLPASRAIAESDGEAAASAARRWTGSQRRRPGGVLLAAGERRGGLRDRPPPAVRAAGRPAQFRRPRRGGPRLRRPLPRHSTSEFPPECREADYERRIKAAYPIHPEMFDRLYTDWSTLKFQRTRGVLA